MQRPFLRIFLVLLATAAVGGLTFVAYHNYPWLFSTQYTIRIATGPVAASGDKFITAFHRELALEYPRVKVKFIRTESLNASAEALKKREVDAALVRSDNPLVAESRTLVIMRKVATIAILGPLSDVEDWSDLKGKIIGVLSESGEIDPLQKVVLEFYDIPQQRIRMVAPKDVGAEIAGKRIAALLAIGPAGPGPIADAARAIRAATKKDPKFLDFDEADAIAARYPAYESLDIPKGTFSGSPPVPSDDATALAGTVRLVSRPSLSQFGAGEITRIVLATKARLAASEPGVGQIEAPDTDKPVFPIHPGTVAYLNGEKPDLIDESLNYLYLGSVVLGVFGTIGAWLAAMWRRRLDREIRTRVAALPSVLGAIKTAPPDDLDRIEGELDQLYEWMVEHHLADTIPAERYGAIEAKLTEIRAIIERRRASAGKDQLPAAKVA
jgi:TRAP-type uncharacterized transport system substrate-binding protein